MELREPILILSDLHLGHPASRLTDPAMLAPLFSGMRTVVFNGDTVETRPRKLWSQRGRMLHSLRDLVEEAGAEMILINGNHDPSISKINHLDLADGAVLVTHGDVLFRNISPWSWEAPLVGSEIQKVLGEMSGDDFASLEKRLTAIKQASLVLEMHDASSPTGRLAGLAAFLREAWPPWRPLSILRCWYQTPHYAEGLARVFRPRARFVVIGHTHYSGVWKRGPRVIVNTGNFLAYSRRLAVVLDQEQMEVRRIVRRNNAFELGSPLATFPVRLLEAVEGF